MDNSAAHIDTNAVTTWLAENLSGFEGPIEAEKFQHGQSNPTFRIITPKQNYVLRRKPPGQLLKSAHAVDREFRVQKALAGSDVPVAKMFAYCADADVIGSEFYIMEEVRGRVFNDPRLPELDRDARGGVMNEMNRVLAAIHDIDINAAGLSDYGPEGNYYRRQIDRWSKQYRSSETQHLPHMEELMVWLDGNIPVDDGQRTLAHGDYRIDNLMFSNDGAECLAVLDWELSTIGHPYADLAAVIMQWAMPAGTEGRGLAGVDREAEGLISDEAFIARYCERRGIPEIPNFGFYLAFCFFRMAGILQGVLKRALDGNASNPERGLRLGEHVPRFASAGLEAAKSV